MTKNVLFVVLFAGFVCSIFSQSLNDFEYTIENDSITITGYKGSVKNVIVPGQIHGLPVVRIGDDAFSRLRLTDITLPDTITVIGERAFSYNHLTNLVLPDSVITVEYMAFSNNRLTNITLSRSLDSIGVLAFTENRLRNINLPDSLTYIGDRAFTRNFMASVFVPASVRNFNSWSFDSYIKITRPK